MNQHIQKLIEYFGSITKAANALGVTPQAVCFWRDGERSISAETASKIEKVTCGQVSRKSLRPADWHLIWPELENK